LALSSPPVSVSLVPSFPSPFVVFVVVVVVQMSVFKKLKKGGKEEKVAVVPDPDPPKALDARIPLDSYRDFFTLKNYWKTVDRKRAEAGNCLLHRYLAQHPEQKTRYAKLKGVDLTSVDTAASNPTFEAVAGAYLKVFDDVIAAVEAKPNDANEACNRLSQVGKMHRTKVSDMDSGLFQMLEEPFLHMVSDILQDRYNEKAETLFRKFYQFCLKYLVEGFNS